MTSRRLRRRVGAAPALRLLFLQLLPALAPLPGGAESEPLRARLSAGSPHEVLLLGVEQEVLRLRPVGEDDGEILLPLSEIEQLHVVLPESYRQAQQDVFNGRAREALERLRPLVQRLLPFAGAPAGNLHAVLAFHLEGLTRAAQWDEALQLVGQLPPAVILGDWLPRVVPLARALQAEGRAAEALALLLRVPLEHVGPPQIALLVAVADDWRREGQLAEAQVLYERLLPHVGASRRGGMQRILAYLDLQSGRSNRAEARLAAAGDAASGDERVLHLLLQAQLAWSRREVDRTLDLAAQAGVSAGATSEWKTAILTLSALAYEAFERPDVAAAIRDDLALREERQLAAAGPAPASVAPPTLPVR